MRPEDVLDAYREGRLSRAEALDAIGSLGALAVGHMARLDVEREARCGVPEVVYGEGKSPEHLRAVVAALLGSGRSAIVTRLSERGWAELGPALAQASSEYHPLSRTLVARPAGAATPPQDAGSVAVVTAGTSDLPVAEECAVIARELGLRVVSFNDVGVAGVHRLLPFLRAAGEEALDCIVVVAGMEGALPSLVAGLVDVPVVGVPTSVGYGAGLGGLTPLLSMLSSCAPGLAVVNVDNGYGAAVLARKVCTARRRREARA